MLNMIMKILKLHIHAPSLYGIPCRLYIAVLRGGGRSVFRIHEGPNGSTASTELLMIPIHTLEGLSVRGGFARTLYRKMASSYEPGRSLFYFGEDRFESAAKFSDRVLDLGSGTGYLSRKLARRARMVVGLERERPMIRQAAGGEGVFIMCWET